MPERKTIKRPAKKTTARRGRVVADGPAQDAVAAAKKEISDALADAKRPRPWRIQLNFEGVGTEQEMWDVVDALVVEDDHRGLFYVHAFIGEMDPEQVVPGSDTHLALKSITGSE